MVWCSLASLAPLIPTKKLSITLSRDHLPSSSANLLFWMRFQDLSLVPIILAAAKKRMPGGPPGRELFDQSSIASVLPLEYWRMNKPAFTRPCRHLTAPISEPLFLFFSPVIALCWCFSLIPFLASASAAVALWAYGPLPDARYA